MEDAKFIQITSHSDGDVAALDEDGQVWKCVWCVCRQDWVWKRISSIRD